MNSNSSVWPLAIGLLVLGGALVLHASVDVGPVYDHSLHIPWWSLAIAFALTERFVVSFDIRSQAVSVNFTEAPLTIGLMLAEPREVIWTRVAVGVLAIVLFRWSAWVKVAFNAGVFAVQTGLAVTVFYLIVGEADPTSPIGWVGALVASAVSFGASAVALGLLMMRLKQPAPFRSQSVAVGVGMVAALAGAAAAAAAASTLNRDGRTWVLLLIIAAAIGLLGLSYVNLRDRYQQLSGVNNYTRALVSELDSEALAREVTCAIADLLQASRVVLLLPTAVGMRRYESIEGKLAIAEEHEVEAFEFETIARVADNPVSWGPGASVAGITLQHTGVMVAPLPVPGRQGIVICDGRMTESRAYDESDRRLLETAASQAATALQNAMLVNRLRTEADTRMRQALHDDVTDLVNSRGLQELLLPELRAGAQIAVLTIRVDSLREVNETLGRATGDVMLREIAKRLKPLARADWCAKTASDEFTVAVPGGADEADMLASRIIEAFDDPVQCDDVALAVTAGIGVALAPEHSTEVEMLLRRASLAASRSRVEGTKVTVWAVDRDPYDPQRLAIAADLRDAIPAGELAVHFQPQVDISSGMVTGAEALVRWRHPRMGELRPDQFIAAAEYTGAIDALTVYVLEQAAKTCAHWRNERGWDLEVGVNVSARNLASTTFAGDVERILSEAGLDPTAVTLELTESSVMSEAAPAMATLHALHRLGVTLSIDDFGTGFSSLAHLRKLPVSEIKIDKSFVFDLVTNRSDEAIVRSMVELGHNLGMTVVVEGVETVEVRRRLDEMQADRIQGYLLSRPIPVAAFEQWIADRPVRMVDIVEDDETGAGEVGLGRRHPSRGLDRRSVLPRAATEGTGDAEQDQQRS